MPIYFLLSPTLIRSQLKYQIITLPKKEKNRELLEKNRPYAATPLAAMSNCSICSILSCFLILFLCSQCTEAYKNYTVGDELGWYDQLEVSSVDYQKWADGKNFSLGDFLIFQTDKNHSVIQTYNATTFKICDADQDMNTTEWSVSNPEYSKDAVTVFVPLLKEGPTYFFSDFYDGEQCLNGQKFAINVTHGQGLPNSLKDPAPDAPGPASADDVPANDVPANFDHPIDDNSTSSDPLKPVAGLGNRNWVRFGFGFFAVVFGSLGLFG